LTQQGEACKAHSAGRPGLRSSPSRAPHPRRRRRAGRAREGGQRQLVLGDQERRPAHLRARFRLSERGRAPARRRTCTAGALGARYSEEASRTRCCRVEGFTDSQAGPGLALAAVRRRRRCAAGSRRGCAGRGAHLVAHVARALQQRRERRRARAGRQRRQHRLAHVLPRPAPDSPVSALPRTRSSRAPADAGAARASARTAARGEHGRGRAAHLVFLCLQQRREALADRAARKVARLPAQRERVKPRPATGAPWRPVSGEVGLRAARARVRREGVDQPPEAPRERIASRRDAVRRRPPRERRGVRAGARGRRARTGPGSANTPSARAASARTAGARSRSRASSAPSSSPARPGDSSAWPASAPASACATRPRTPRSPACAPAAAPERAPRRRAQRGRAAPLPAAS